MTLSSDAASAVSQISTEIRIRGPEGDLVGTLVTPPASKAVVLIIPGFGPTDRDGNNPLGVTAQPYKLLAQGLALQGIASVRADKRGMFSSAQAVADANAVTVDDYVQDTLSWVGAIQQRMPTGEIWLMGHSEGGLIALAAARTARNHAGICGLILLATPGRPFAQILANQIKSNPANAAIFDAATAAINTLAAGQHIQAERLPAPLQTLFRQNVQGFLISLFSLEPAKLIEQIAMPILIAQGGRDLQVACADAERLKRHQPSASLEMFPEANHLMKQVATEDLDANIATYGNPNLPLVPHLVDKIAKFVKRK